MVTHSSAAGGPAGFVIGRDLAPAGRLVRVLAGLLNLAAAAGIARLSAPISPVDAVGVVLAFLVTASAYTGGIWLLGDRLLPRLDPWLTALVLVAPLGVLFVVPMVPDPVTIGAFLYIAVSQLVQAAIGYGGCEVAGIPTLLLRSRHTIYCYLNCADLVEHWLHGQPNWVTWCLAVLTFAITTALGALAQTIGQAAGFFAAYLAFLLMGPAVSRVILATRSRSAEAR
jgi:hypothetical protein